MNKKAISDIIGYVLLIVIAISISLLVYSWIKGYIPANEKNCPEGISLGIEYYLCNNDNLNITLKNNGLFDVNGFVIRISNLTKGRAVYYLKTGSYIENYFNAGLKPLASQQEESFNFNYGNYGLLTRIEIEPFKTDKVIILCKDAIIQQEIKCD